MKQKFKDCLIFYDVDDEFEDVQHKFKKLYKYNKTLDKEIGFKNFLKQKNNVDIIYTMHTYLAKLPATVSELKKEEITQKYNTLQEATEDILEAINEYTKRRVIFKRYSKELLIKIAKASCTYNPVKFVMTKKDKKRLLLLDLIDDYEERLEFYKNSFRVREEEIVHLFAIFDLKVSRAMDLMKFYMDHRSYFPKHLEYEGIKNIENGYFKLRRRGFHT